MLKLHQLKKDDSHNTLRYSVEPKNGLSNSSFVSVIDWKGNKNQGVLTTSVLVSTVGTQSFISNLTVHGLKCTAQSSTTCSLGKHTPFALPSEGAKVFVDGDRHPKTVSSYDVSEINDQKKCLVVDQVNITDDATGKETKSQVNKLKLSISTGDHVILKGKSTNKGEIHNAVVVKVYGKSVILACSKEPYFQADIMSIQFVTNSRNGRVPPLFSIRVSHLNISSLVYPVICFFKSIFYYI